MDGALVGPYRLLARIGSGGMGVVWLATVEGAVPGVPVGERVAVKIVHPHLVADPDVFERFVHEAAIGRAIRHENVVRTLDAGMDAGDEGIVVYLAMERVTGRTLAALRDAGPQPEGLVRRVAREAARGLRAIHERGVVHGDVKPENLVLTRDEVVKVMDLGLARLRDRAPRQTSGGGFSGSLLYAAPEQFGGRADAADPRIDLFALGATLWELAAGRHPWARDDDAAFVPRQLDADAPPLREAAPGTSEFLEAVVRGLLARDPARRIGSAAELSAILLAGEEGAWFRGVRAAAAGRDAAEAAPLRGREAELAELWRLVREAGAGRGGTALVTGEPGSGGTRLVAALCDAVLGAALAIDADRRSLGHGRRGADAVTGVDAPPAPGRTRLCVVEGVTHADDRAWAVIAEASRRAATTPLVLVLTTDAPMPLLRRETLARGTVELVLGPLDDEALADAAADALLTGRPAASLVRWLAARSRGNAGVALAWLRSLVARGALRSADDGTWTRAADDPGAEAPPEVLAWGEAALAGVSSEDRELLEACACAGWRFDAALVAEVSGAPRNDIDARCGVLARRGIVRRAADDRWEFVAAATHAALVAGVSASLRPEYARAFAGALASRERRTAAESADLVRHLLAAGETAPPAGDVRAAVVHLERAAQWDEVVAVADAAAATGDTALARDAVVWKARALLADGRADEARAALAAWPAS